MVHRALLVGCNYPGNSAARHLSYGNTYIMRDFLISSMGVKNENIRVLTDERDREGTPGFANLANFKAELARLIKETKKDDTVIFYFSGQGGQQESEDKNESDGKDEVIYLFDPSKGRDSDDALVGFVDNELFDQFLKPLDNGATLMSFFDCEHSGTMVDLPFNYVPGPGLMAQGNPESFGNEKAVAIGACSDGQDEIAEGLLTTAIIMAFGKANRKHKGATWTQIAEEIFKSTGSTGSKQIPVVSFSKEAYAKARAY